MLLVGIDWAEARHAVCLLAADGTLVRRLSIPHDPGGLQRLHTALTEAEPDPTAVLVAIERPDGLLVDALLTAGYGVYALNPKAVGAVPRAHAHHRRQERSRGCRAAGAHSPDRSRPPPPRAPVQPPGRDDPHAGAPG